MPGWATDRRHPSVVVWIGWHLWDRHECENGPDASPPWDAHARPVNSWGRRYERTELMRYTRRYT